MRNPFVLPDRRSVQAALASLPTRRRRLVAGFVVVATIGLSAAVALVLAGLVARIGPSHQGWLADGARSVAGLAILAAAVRVSGNVLWRLTEPFRRGADL